MLLHQREKSFFLVLGMAAFADILLPLGAAACLTYRIPKRYRGRVVRGMRAIVPFKSTLLGGIVWHVHDCPGPHRLRDILEVPDPSPLWKEDLCRLTAWMQKYYISSLGEVARVTLEGSKWLLTPELTCKRPLPDALSMPSPDGALTWHHILNHLGVAEGITFLDQEVAQGTITLAPPLFRVAKSGVSSQRKKKSPTCAQGIMDPNLREEQQALSAYLQEGKKIFIQGGDEAWRGSLYRQAALEQIRRGRQVLYLVADKRRLERVHAAFSTDLGSASVGTYHSEMKQEERKETAQRVACGELGLVVARLSAIFLPFADLGLVIISASASRGYRTLGAPPYYQGRDTAIMRAHYHGIPVVLGDALPSIASYYNQKIGKYAGIHIGSRRRYPIAVIHPIKSKRPPYAPAPLAPQVVAQIQEKLANHQQVVVLQGRRGYAHYHRCVHCAWLARCPTCSISLTYHQDKNLLLCHHCGTSQVPYPECPECGATELSQHGVGIQQIEEWLGSYFPAHKPVRIDADQRRGKRYDQRLRDFQEGKILLLLGTPQLLKELPLGAPELAVLLDQGYALAHHGPQAEERALQELAHIARTVPQVIVQTDTPEMRRLVAHLTQGEEVAFYEHALMERKKYGYPPFSHWIEVTWYAAKTEVLWAEAERLVAHLKRRDFSLLGPFPQWAENNHPRGVGFVVQLSPHLLAQKKEQLTKAIDLARRPALGVKLCWTIDPL